MVSMFSTTKSTEMTKQYYDLATDFFEYGWGESFHFYVMCKEESRQTSCLKHEYRLAVKLGLKAGLKCLVNCCCCLDQYYSSIIIHFHSLIVQ